MKNRMKYSIEKYKPCEDVLKWYNDQPSTEEAWKNCTRGDWMLWAASMVIKVDDKILTKAKYLCASTVRHLMTDQRSLNALDACKKYVDGEITRDELNKYAYAAKVAVDADYSDEASDAAYSASSSIDYVAFSSASTAAQAAATTYALNIATHTTTDAYAAYVVAHATEKNKHLMLTANICREILTEEIFKKIIEGYEMEIFDRKKEIERQENQIAQAEKAITELKRTVNN